ncbi:CocE/NonD family hydrolase [Streptomyces canus]|uniref:CocE/NonD family hydrolase n=1 Tax=Streptomyces canus TaxID=58343 RepID=UPI0037169960
MPELSSQTVIRTTAVPVPEGAEQHLVAMRDGVRLATDVYHGSEPDLPRPVMLTRLPYDKGSRYVFFYALAPLVLARGYVLVVQDVRGKFRSEGETLSGSCEVNDGYDTIDWIAAQPWCDGNVGMFGDSYFGFTQWAAVAAGHPALKAISPRVTSMELLQDMASSEPMSLTLCHYLLCYWADNDIWNIEPDWDTRPLVKALEAAEREIGAGSRLLHQLVPERTADPLYPAGHPLDADPVPVLHGVGWFDNLLGWSMRDHTRLAADPRWAPCLYLRAEAVDHEYHHLSDVPLTKDNDHSLDDDALQRKLPHYVGPTLDFFDVFLRGGDPASYPRVTWDLGAVETRTDTQWPPTGSRPLALHLDLGEGALTEEPAASATASWTCDPSNPLRSAAPDPFAFLAAYPDESAAAARSDVLASRSRTRTEPLDLAGPITLTLRIDTTAPSTDVFAKLYDVDPTGAAHMIARGQTHIAAPDPLDEMRIDLSHTGYRIAPGHRLQVHLTSSDFPDYLPHPGTDDNRWLATHHVTSTQTLHEGTLQVTVLP